MALSPQERGRVLRYLEPKYKKAYEDGILSDDDLQQWGVDAGVLGADFSGVSAVTDTTGNQPPVEKDTTLNSVLADILSGAGPDSAPSVLATPANALRTAAAIADPAAREALSSSAIGGAAGFSAGALNLADLLRDSPLEAIVPGSAIISDEGMTDALALARDIQRQNTERSQEALGRVAPGLAQETVETGTDILGSPESFLSVLGPAGAIPAVGGAFARNLDAATIAGMSGEKAALYAAAKTAPSVLEFLPGRVGRGITKNVDDLFDTMGLNLLKRGGAEGLTETAQSAAEMAIDKAFATYSEDDQIREHAATQVPESTAQFFDNLWRSLRAGTAAGTILATPGEIMTVISEAGARVSALNDVSDTAARRAAARPVEAQPEPVPEPVVTPATVEPDMAAIRLQNAEEQRLNIQNRVDTARQEVEALQGDVEAGDRSDATLSAFALANRNLRQAEQLLSNQEQRIRTMATPAPVVEEAVEAAVPAPEPAVVEDPARVAAREKARKSVEKMVTKDEGAARKSALSTRAAARRKFLAEQQATMRELPTQERIERLTDEAVTWDEQNPLENFFKTPAAPAPAKTPRAATPATTTEAAPADTATTIEDMRNRLRSQRTDEIDTGVTAERIVQELKGDVTGKAAGRVAGLASAGNLEIVDRQEDVPATAELQQQGKGFFDPATGKVILIANTVDPANITGDILSTLSHEVKHAADLGAFTTSRPSLRNLIGDENNAAIVTQIEELATKDTPEGQAAAATLQMVRENYPEDQWIEEIPANYINTAVESETGVIRNILSAVRTKYKDVTGNEDVNIADLKYLADQLLRESAQSEGFTPTEGEPLSMIVGKSHPLFEEFKKAGKTYTSRDGQEKFVLSDVGSGISIFNDEARSFLQGREARIGEVVDHPELFSAYPQLKDITIRVDNTLSEGSAAYRENPKEITVAPSLMMEIALSGNRGKPYMRSTLLHELQHAVQAIEGHALGGNANMFATPAEVRQERDYEHNLNSIRFIVSTLTKSGGAGLDHTTQTELRHIGEIFGDELNEGVVNEVMGALLEDGTRFGRSIHSELSKLLGRREEMWPTLEAARTRRNREYHALQGEIEAYWTGLQRNLSQQAISPFPEDRRDAGGFVGTGIQQSDEVILQQPSGDRTRIRAQVLPPRHVKISNNKVQQNQVKRAVKRLLLPGGGFEPQLNEILRHGTNLPASLAIEGTHLGNQLLTAMKRNVASSKGRLTEDGIRKSITERMDKIDELPTLAERQAAVVGLDREFPGVGSAINAMREFKLGFTDELLALRIRDPKPMTEKEVATYEKMVKNAERYTTRAYLATYNQDVGQQYAKSIMKKFEQDPESKEGKVVQDAIDYLVTNELLIPDTEALAKLPMPQLRRMYDSYFGDVDKFKGAGNRAIFVQRLESIDKTSTNELESKALEIVKDMLGMNDTKGSVARALQGSMRQNRTILETRTDMPEPLRKLLGEITDPFLRESISLHRMINLVSKTKVLTELFEQGADADWWSDTRTGKHARQLNNVAYGPLDGKWISQDVADAITGTVLSMNSVDSALADMAKDPDAISKLVSGAVLPGMHRVMSIQKTWGVVASAANMLYNLGGAVVVGAPTQGVFNPVKMLRAMHDTAGTLALEVSDRFTSERQVGYASELVRAGVTDSATMGEFRSQAYQAILKEIKKIAPDTKNPGTAFFKAVWKGVSGQGSTANALRQAYAFMDVWTKVATYQDRKQFLTKFNKAENAGMTPEEIERRAGYEAAGTNISYERAIPLAKILERNVPVAMFLTYFSEVPRALTMSYIQVVRDFKMAADAKTPAGKTMAFNMAMSRFIGTAAATAGITAATYAALDSEDDDEKRKRELDAPWMRNQVLIPIGLDDKGNAMHIALNRFDPWGPFNESLMDIMRAPEGERAETAVQTVMDLFVQSKGVMSAVKLMTDAVVQGAATATGSRPPEWKFLNRKKTTIIEENYPQAYEFIRETVSAGDIGENSVEVLENLFLPAVFTPVIDENRSKVETLREEDVPVVGDVLRATGGNAYVRDPDKSLYFRGLDYTSEIKALRSEFKEAMEFSKYKDVGDMAEDFTRISEEERQAFNKLHKAYDGHLAFSDRSHRTAAEALGDRNKKLAQKLRNGNFKPEIATVDKLNDWYKDAVKLTSDPKEKAELQKRRDIMKKVLIDSRSVQ